MKSVKRRALALCLLAALLLPALAAAEELRGYDAKAGYQYIAFSLNFVGDGLRDAFDPKDR